MFAEPVNKSKVNEQFQLVCINTKQQVKVIQHADIGLQKSSYQYTLRNIYYSNQTHSLIQELFRTKCKTCDQIHFQRSEDNFHFTTLESFTNEQ